VPGRLQVALDEHGVVTERRRRLAAGPGHGVGQLGGSAHDPHPPAAAAGGGLDQQGPADLVGDRPDLVGGHPGQVGAGQDRQPVGLGQLPGGQLGAHHLDYRGARPHEGEAGLPARLGKGGVLRQEPIARMDGVGSRPQGGVDHDVDAQVRLRRRGPAERHRLVRRPHMGCAAVGIGEHRHRGQAHLPGGAEDAHGYLGPVGHEELVQLGHSGTVLTCGTRRSRASPRSRWSGRPTGPYPARPGCRAGRAPRRRTPARS
jgi:hypothetical protein